MGTIDVKTYNNPRICPSSGETDVSSRCDFILRYRGCCQKFVADQKAALLRQPGKFAFSSNGTLVPAPHTGTGGPESRTDQEVSQRVLLAFGRMTGKPEVEIPRQDAQLQSRRPSTRSASHFTIRAYIFDVANRPTETSGIRGLCHGHAGCGGFAGGERYVWIDRKANSSYRQARRNDRNTEDERSQHAGMFQLRCGQRLC